MLDYTADTPVDIRAELGNPDSVKRSLRQECAKHMPKNPAALCDLTLYDKWTTTGNGDQFLIYDSGEDSSDRMLVFRPLTMSKQ